MTLFKRIVICICSVIIVFSVIYFNGDKNEQLNILRQISNVEDKYSVNVSNKIACLDEVVGYLTIENIGMYKEAIKEGVDDSILKYNIGHFSNTSVFNGNVCLAGHNYKINTSQLFCDLNKLNINDSIIYTTKHGSRKYIVYKKYEIKNNDFSILENTKENIITLVTCVGNRKDIRLCVIAKEFKEVEI